MEANHVSDAPQSCNPFASNTRVQEVTYEPEDQAIPRQIDAISSDAMQRTFCPNDQEMSTLASDELMWPLTFDSDQLNTPLSTVVPPIYPPIQQLGLRTLSLRRGRGQGVGVRQNDRTGRRMTVSHAQNSISSPDAGVFPRISGIRPDSVVKRPACYKKKVSKARPALESDLKELRRLMPLDHLDDFRAICAIDHTELYDINQRIVQTAISCDPQQGTFEIMFIRKECVWETPSGCPGLTNVPHTFYPMLIREIRLELRIEARNQNGEVKYICGHTGCIMNGMPRTFGRQWDKQRHDRENHVDFGCIPCPLTDCL